MTTQLHRIVFAAAILATATGARAGESAMTAGRRDAARVASVASVASSQDLDAADRDPRAGDDAPSRLDCPSGVPRAPGAASVETGYAGPGAQLVWVGP